MQIRGTARWSRSVRYIDCSDGESLDVAPSIRGMSLLHNYKLISAPEGLEDAVSLRYLDLSNNGITKLPNMSRLTQLEIAYFDNNQISTPIEGIDQLPFLYRLGCSNKPCTQILDQLSPAQTQIDMLRLNGVLTVLPTGLSDCISLFRLGVSDDDILISIYLENFSQVCCCLQISNNRLQSLSGIESATSLYSLSVSEFVY